MRVYLINSAGVSLGVLTIEDTVMVIGYYGSMYARDGSGVGVIFRGDLFPVFREVPAVYAVDRLDIDLVAERAKSRRRRYSARARP